MKTEEVYRLAKLHNDIDALTRVFADGFNETNQNGNSRNKVETIDLWKTFRIRSLTTDTHEVRVNGSTAMVTGTQTENGSETDAFHAGVREKLERLATFRQHAVPESQTAVSLAHSKAARAR